MRFSGNLLLVEKCIVDKELKGSNGSNNIRYWPDEFLFLLLDFILKKPDCTVSKKGLTLLIRFLRFLDMMFFIVKIRFFIVVVQ